jgi:choline-phosphate cytidylyltransferase
MSPCRNDIYGKRKYTAVFATASLSCAYAAMDSSNALSDDDYDVVSNPGRGSLDSSFDEYHDALGPWTAVRELPAFEEAKDRFETTRWTASDIQAYLHKGLNLTTPAPKKLVRIYVDGPFDTFDVG